MEFRKRNLPRSGYGFFRVNARRFLSLLFLFLLTILASLVTYGIFVGFNADQVNALSAAEQAKQLGENGWTPDNIYKDSHWMPQALNHPDVPSNQKPFLLMGSDGVGGTSFTGFYRPDLFFTLWIPSEDDNGDPNNLSNYKLNTYDLCSNELNFKLDNNSDRPVKITIVGKSLGRQNEKTRTLCSPASEKILDMPSIIPQEVKTFIDKSDKQKSKKYEKYLIRFQITQGGRFYNRFRIRVEPKSGWTEGDIIDTYLLLDTNVRDAAKFSGNSKGFTPFGYANQDNFGVGASNWVPNWSNPWNDTSEDHYEYQTSFAFAADIGDDCSLLSSPETVRAQIGIYDTDLNIHDWGFAGYPFHQRIDSIKPQAKVYSIDRTTYTNNFRSGATINWGLSPESTLTFDGILNRNDNNIEKTVPRVAPNAETNVAGGPSSSNFRKNSAYFYEYKTASENSRDTSINEVRNQAGTYKVYRAPGVTDPRDTRRRIITRPQFLNELESRHITGVFDNIAGFSGGKSRLFAAGGRSGTSNGFVDNRKIKNINDQQDYYLTEIFDIGNFIAWDSGTMNPMYNKTNASYQNPSTSRPNHFEDTVDGRNFAHGPGAMVPAYISQQVNPHSLSPADKYTSLMIDVSANEWENKTYNFRTDRVYKVEFINIDPRNYVQFRAPLDYANTVQVCEETAEVGLTADCQLYIKRLFWGEEPNVSLKLKLRDKRDKKNPGTYLNQLDYQSLANPSTPLTHQVLEEWYDQVDPPANGLNSTNLIAELIDPASLVYSTILNDFHNYEFVLTGDYRTDPNDATTEVVGAFDEQVVPIIPDNGSPPRSHGDCLSFTAKIGTKDCKIRFDELNISLPGNPNPDLHFEILYKGTVVNQITYTNHGPSNLVPRINQPNLGSTLEIVDLTDADTYWFARARGFNFRITGYYDTGGAFRQFQTVDAFGNITVITPNIDISSTYLADLPINNDSCVPPAANCNLLQENVFTIDTARTPLRQGGQTSTYSAGGSLQNNSPTHWMSHHSWIDIIPGTPYSAGPPEVLAVPPTRVHRSHVHRDTYTGGHGAKGAKALFNFSELELSTALMEIFADKVTLNGNPGEDKTDTTTILTGNSRPVRVRPKFDVTTDEVYKKMRQTVWDADTSLIETSGASTIVGIQWYGNGNNQSETYYTYTFTVYVKSVAPTSDLTNPVYRPLPPSTSGNDSMIAITDNRQLLRSTIQTYLWDMDWKLDITENIKRGYTWTSWDQVRSSGHASAPVYGWVSHDNRSTATNTLTWRGNWQTCSQTMVVQIPECSIVNLQPNTAPPKHKEKFDTDGNGTQETVYVYPVGASDQRTVLKLVNPNVFGLKTDKANHPEFSIRGGDPFPYITYDQNGVPRPPQNFDSGQYYNGDPNITRSTLNMNSHIPAGGNYEYREPTTPINLPGKYLLIWKAKWQTDGQRSGDWQGEEHVDDKCFGQATTPIFIWADPPLCKIEYTIFEVGDVDTEVIVTLTNPNQAPLDIMSAEYIINRSAGSPDNHRGNGLLNSKPITILPSLSTSNNHSHSPLPSPYHSHSSPGSVHSHRPYPSYYTPHAYPASSPHNHSSSQPHSHFPARSANSPSHFAPPTQSLVPPPPSVGAHITSPTSPTSHSHTMRSHYHNPSSSHANLHPPQIGAGSDVVLKSVKRPILTNGVYDFSWKINTNMGNESWTTLDFVSGSPEQNSWFENLNERITTAGPNGTIECKEKLRIAVRPYLKVFYGDVNAGGYFGRNEQYDACADGNVLQTWSPTSFGEPEGYIAGHSEGSNIGNAKGSSVKHGVQAYDIIGGFYSSSQRDYTTQAPQPLKGLTLHNNNSIDEFGGGFAKPSCIGNYWREVTELAEEENLSTNDIEIDISTDLEANDRKRYILKQGQKLILKNSSSNLDNLKATLFVEGEGNVYIKNNIINNDSSSASWEDPSEIGYITIIARGNIYIDPGVTQIDALLVAYPKEYSPALGINIALGGEIWTCYFDGMNQISHSTRCNQNSLVINGALIAQKVRFGRIDKSVKQATGTPEDENNHSASETVNLLPEFLIGTPELPIFADQIYKSDSISVQAPNF